MPRKHAVYGKRTAPSYLSSNFATFSPAKSYKRPVHIRYERTPSPTPHEQEAAITSLETALEELNVAADDGDAVVFSSSVAEMTGFSLSKRPVVTSIETAIEQLDVKADEDTAGIPAHPKGVLQPKSPNPIQKPKASKSKPDKASTNTTSREQTTTAIPPKSLRPRRIAPFPKLISPQPPPILDTLTSHAQPLLDLCTSTSTRPASILDFETWAQKACKRFTVSKIAEASYGEVYRLTSRSISTACSESVFKLIPLQPPPPPNNQKASRKRVNTNYMSSIPSVTSELSLLRLMSPIPGFTSFRGASIMRGPLPPAFTAAWKAYKALQKAGLKKCVDGGSMFPDPTRRGAYSGEQLWAVIEMQDAGSDLENVVLEGGGQVWDVFWGVASALAKGEEGRRFEHRDLHLGNICVRANGPRHEEDGKEGEKEGWRFGMSGLETTIIDYTLSRAEMRDESSSSGKEEGGEVDVDVAFYDLERDQALFQGDARVDAQYEVYRMMRNEVFKTPSLASHSQSRKDSRQLQLRQRGSSICRHVDIAREEEGWKAFVPRTNVLWLGYVLDQLLKRCLPSPSSSSSSSSEESESEERNSKESQAEDVQEHVLFEKMQRLRALMAMVREGGGKKRGFESAGEVVGFALEEAWLDVHDVVG